MAKKKVGFNLIGLILAVVAIISVILFACLPMVKSVVKVISIETTTTYGGFGMIFGGNANIVITAGNSTTKGTLEDIGFNAIAFIAFLVVVLGAIGQILSVFVKKVAKCKYSFLASSALVLLGGILMFCVKGGALAALDLTDASDSFVLAVGPILAGILACLSGAAGVVLKVLKK